MTVVRFDPSRRKWRGRNLPIWRPRRSGGRRQRRFVARLLGATAALFALTLVAINGDARQMALAAVGTLARDGSDVQAMVADVARPAAADRLRASFTLCHTGGGTNCVVDGDTFWFVGQKIRIADIDTPETHPPRCAAEAEKGRAATLRLQALLNEGAFALEGVDRDSDVYGRKLRVVTRGGQSLGGVLVNEGLARWVAGGRRGWC